VTRAPAFTLLEVMVAIVLMSVVALLAYATANVSVGIRVRLGDALREQQSDRASRELLQDALRNVRAPQQPEDTTFTLQSSRLSFVAAGAGPPFDSDHDWRITIQPESDGVEVVAVPVGRAPPAEVTFRLSGVTRWDVRVLDANGPNWLHEWNSEGMPRAVAITLWDRAGPMGQPIRVTLAPSRTMASGAPYAP
jgi:prepilin-type N-terminal cleavage/methylation domain-containing protein